MGAAENGKIDIDSPKDLGYIVGRLAKTDKNFKLKRACDLILGVCKLTECHDRYVWR